MYAQVRHPWRTRPVRVIPKGRTCAAGSQYFASLCLSATFDTTLAGTQQVHPCMLNCAILGAQACTRYTERPNLRCWLLALRSTLFICHFRYNACRHAASTSMYAQVRHPWRTRPVRVIPKGRTCASGSQLSALSSQLSALGSRLSALGSQLPAPSSQLPAPSSQLPAPSSQLPAPSPQPSALSPQPSALSPQPSALSPQPSALSPQPSALSPRLSALGSRLSALGSRLPALNFPNNNPSKTESRYLDIFAF